MTYAAARISVTNEAAIRPHENAFQRWSMVDASELPHTGFQPMSTDRHNTMEEHMPSSFRVYSPAETRSAPMRRGSMHEIEQPSETVGVRTLLKWTGIGIVAGLCVLTALLLVLNLGDDSTKAVASASARATLKLDTTPVSAAPVKVASIPVVDVVMQPVVDIELDATPPPKKPAKKVSTTKKR